MQLYRYILPAYTVQHPRLSSLLFPAFLRKVMNSFFSLPPFPPSAQVVFLRPCWAGPPDPRQHLCVGAPPEDPPVLFRPGTWPGDVRQGELADAWCTPLAPVRTHARTHAQAGDGIGPW
jgi:hypothetical protein